MAEKDTAATVVDAPPTRAEVKAAADQDAIDRERGYRKIEWKPNVWMWQHLVTQHTEAATEGGELNMIRHHNEYRMSQIG